MRQFKIRLVHHYIIIGEKVDVDGARSPSVFSRPVAAKLLFDLQRAFKQSARRKPGCDQEARIDEGGLVCNSPGWRLVVRRTAEECDLTPIAKQRDGAVECVATITLVAAECNQHLTHDASV